MVEPYKVSWCPSVEWCYAVDWLNVGTWFDTCSSPGARMWAGSLVYPSLLIAQTKWFGIPILDLKRDLITLIISTKNI